MTKLPPPSQLGFVVPSVDEAATIWWERWGVGPWRIWNFGDAEVADRTVDGEPSAYSMRIGVAKWGGLDMELIEPLDDKSIYARSLAAHGGRRHLHHLRFRPKQYEACIADLEEMGFPPIQTGGISGGIFHYFDTEDEVGTIFETSQVPTEHRLPPGEQVIPKEG